MSESSHGHVVCVLELCLLQFDILFVSSSSFSARDIDIHCVSEKNVVVVSNFLRLHFKTFVSHGSATKFLRNGEKYYIYFRDNLLLFPTVKECSKSVNS